MEPDMRLPDGKTCADCVHVRRCVALGFSWPTRTGCDFSPIRFVLRIHAPASPKEPPAP